MWCQRDISLYGRINMIKTLALLKLTFICSALDTPENFADEANRIIFDFISTHKPSAKIRKATPVKNKKEGGLNMNVLSVR